MSLAFTSVCSIEIPLLGAVEDGSYVNERNNCICDETTTIINETHNGSSEGLFVVLSIFGAISCVVSLRLEIGNQSGEVSQLSSEFHLGTVV